VLFRDLKPENVAVSSVLLSFFCSSCCVIESFWLPPSCTFLITNARSLSHSQPVLILLLQFDVRARVKLFDFGLARELKAADLVAPPDGYHATGLTGSRRYMAPEVVLCKHYGFAADLYSFGIVVWETFSGKSAYDGMDYDKHFEYVVMRGKRPNLRCISTVTSTTTTTSPQSLALLLKQMWDPDPAQRGDFTSVCDYLKHESNLLRYDHIPNGHYHHLSDRTQYLMGQSERSE
jgi:serine/threonine protein kinase